MPHFQIDYSGNVEDWVDMGGLCETIRAEAARIEAFPMPGIRVRALRADHCAIADGAARHGFIDISVRLRAGRPHEVKAAAAQRIFEAARSYLDPVMARPRWAKEKGPRAA